MKNAFSDLHCSLADVRSSTDPVTNWTLISGTQLDTDVRMLVTGRYPSRLFPEFLHEIVHHWCFHSSVGATLAYLQLRARRRALPLMRADTKPSIASDASYEVWDDILRYETAITLMRPLAEGLALFAEFDIMPGDSDVSSLPLEWAIRNFAIPSQEEIEGGPKAVLQALLLQHRVSKEFCKRKSNLLVQSFTTDNGGYLPGYLLVKNLWHTMIYDQKCSRFADKDLFLSYVRSFFYEDFGFVAALLDSDTSDFGCVRSVIIYLQDRFIEFMKRTTDATIAQFEQEVSALSARNSQCYPSLTELPSLQTDPRISKTGRDRLSSLLDEINFEGTPNNLDQQLKRMNAWSIAQRELMCIGSFKEKVRVNEHGRVFVGHATGTEALPLQIPVFTGPALKGVEAGEGEGSMEFFISPARRYRVVAVSLQGKVVAMEFLGDDIDEILKEQLITYQTSYNDASTERAIWQSLLNDFVSRYEFDVKANVYRAEMKKFADKIYVKESLFFTPAEKTERCIDAMRENGFYEILNQDSKLIESLAKLSLVNGLSPDKQWAATVMAYDGVNLDDLLKVLDNSGESYGLPIVNYDGKSLTCFM